MAVQLEPLARPARPTRAAADWQAACGVLAPDKRTRESPFAAAKAGCAKATKSSMMPITTRALQCRLGRGADGGS